MKERPILFSADMVRAILAGRKTQTRRVVKPEGTVNITPFMDSENKPTGEYGWHSSECIISKHIFCPYGQPGDRLWVRETWACLNSKVRPGSCIVYRANTADGERVRCDAPWRPSIHMPRWASRITLEVTAVRVQRLQEITDEDAIAEGIISYPYKWESMDYPYQNIAYQPFEGSEYRYTNPKDAFKDLWDSINAKRGCTWDSNPWVWAVSFKVVTPC